MAEIKIEKKRSVWPLILIGLLVAAGIVYLFYSLTTVRDDEVTASTTEAVEPNNNDNTIAEFVSYVNNDTNKMSLDHSYTNGALLRLTEAINSKANAIGYNVKADLDKVKEYANSITNDPFETSHGDNIRKAADILSTSLGNMQQAKYPALGDEVKEVRSAASSIDPDELTLNQKDAVKSFFREAADLLQKMN